MQLITLEFASSFHVVAGNARGQAAIMVLPVGDSTGGPDNRHADSDQWLYVVAGEGEAVVEGQQQRLQTGTLLLIERGEAHEIRNLGSEPLKTLNVYVPPAYSGAEGRPPERD